MKNFCLIALLACFFTGTSAQENTVVKAKPAPPVDSLPYQKYPTLPAFNILLLDSSTIVNTYNIPEGKPTLIMFFDPECGHCKIVTRGLVNKMDSLKDIRIYMITSVHDFNKIRMFYDEFHLGEYKNVEVVGRDYEFFFVTYFGIKYVPDLVLYDAHKNLVKYFEGHASVSELYKLTH